MKHFFARVGALLIVSRVLFMGYGNTGPFTSNALPALDATFFNNIENFLDTVTSIATDHNNTSDGNGNATVKSMHFTTGKITRIAKAGPYTVNTTEKAFNHNLGAVPDFVAVTMISGFTGANSCYVDFGNLTSSQVSLQSSVSGGLGVYILSLKL